jgi:hypothetical protein
MKNSFIPQSIVPTTIPNYLNFPTFIKFSQILTPSHSISTLYLSMTSFGAPIALKINPTALNNLLPRMKKVYSNITISLNGDLSALIFLIKKKLMSPAPKSHNKMAGILLKLFQMSLSLLNNFVESKIQTFFFGLIKLNAMDANYNLEAVKAKGLENQLNGNHE